MNTYYDKDYFEARDILPANLVITIKNLMRANKLEVLLDVGCGSGQLVKFMNNIGFCAKGCDLSTAAVKKARKINKKGSIVRASATYLPFVEKSFDIVTCISVVEHLTPKEVETFFKETRRVLKEDGYVFLVTPNFQAALKFIQGKNWFGYRDPTHINFYTPQKLSNTLKKHGFANMRLTFKCKYHKSFEWEFPSFFPKLPKPLKILLIYLLFSTPLFIIRNSFWLAAQKK